MTTKRKRANTKSVTSNKPQKKVRSSQLQLPVDETFYKLRQILEETESQYLIDWSDNSDTGETYEPTWEPKANANENAVKHWKRLKRNRKKKAATAVKARNPIKSKSKDLRKPTPIVNKPIAARSTKSISLIDTEEDLQLTGTLDCVSTQSVADEVRQITPSRKAPVVHIPQPTPGFDPGAYERVTFSQTSSSQLAPAAVSLQHTPLPVPHAEIEPSQYIADSNDKSKSTAHDIQSSIALTSPSEELVYSQPLFLKHNNGVVPDSQSQPDSASFVPTNSQDVSHTSGYSTAIDSIQSGEATRSHTQESVVVIHSIITNESGRLQETITSSYRAITRSPAENTAQAFHYSSQLGDTGLTSDDRQQHQPSNLSQPLASTTPGLTKQISHDQVSSIGPADISSESIDKSASHSEQSQHTHFAQARETDAQSSTIVDCGIHWLSQPDPNGQASATSVLHRETVPSQPSEEEPVLCAGSKSFADVCQDQSSGEEQIESSRILRSSAQAHPSTAPSNIVETFEKRTASSTSVEQVEPTSSLTKSPSRDDIETFSPGFQTQIEPHSSSDAQRQGLRSQERLLSLEFPAEPGINLSQAVPETSLRLAVENQSNQFYSPPRKSSATKSTKQDHSDFQFKTQVSGPSSPASNLGSTPTSAPTKRSKLLEKLKAVQLFRQYRSLSPERGHSTISSPIQTHSPLSFTVGTSGPAPPRTVSSIHQTPQRAYSMDPPSSAPSPFSENLRKNREKRRALFMVRKQGDSPQESPRPFTAGQEHSEEMVAQPSPTAMANIDPLQPSAPTGDLQPLPGVHIEPPSAIPPHLTSPSRSNRSPSMVPAVQPIPNVTQEEQNTSERFESLLPQASLGREDSLRRTSSHHRAGDHQQKLSREHPHVVPISLISRQRDHYITEVFRYRRRIGQYLRGLDSLSPYMKQLIDRLERVTLHPDLVDFEAMTQFNAAPSQRAEWDVQCSSKFRFLKDLLDKLRDQACRVIVVGPEMVLDILDKFLEGIHVSHWTLSDDSVKQFDPSKGKLEVLIVSDEEDSEFIQSKNLRSDLIVLLEGSSTAAQNVASALRQDLSGSELPTVITLVIPYSHEHIELSVPKLPASTQSPTSTNLRLKAIVRNVTDVDHEVGRIDSEHHAAPADAARSIASYVLLRDSKSEWPLNDLDPLEDIDEGSEIDMDLGDRMQSGIKRANEDDDMIEDSSKKARVDTNGDETGIPMTINPFDMDLTTISDSVENPSQSVESSGEDLVLSLQKAIKQMRMERDDRITALEDLQYRYEEQFQQLHAFRKERDTSIRAAEATSLRLAASFEKLGKVSTARDEYRQQLREAEEKLVNHTSPELAQLELLRQEAQKAKEAQAKAESRLLACQRDVDFFRGQYQEASQNASRLGSQEKDLLDRLAIAEEQASGEHARLRKMGYDAQYQNLQRENKQLKAVVKDRENVIKLKDEEITKLKEAGRGRIGTRSGSIPRSPRLASPMIGEDLHVSRSPAARSRQASPMGHEARGRGSSHLNPARSKP